MTNEPAGKGAEAEIDGRFPEFAIEVGRILGWNGADGEQVFSTRMAARKTGISYGTIASIARGDRPKADTIAKFAEGMNADRNSLLRAAGYLSLDNSNWKPLFVRKDPLDRIGSRVSREGFDDKRILPHVASAGQARPNTDDNGDEQTLGEIVPEDLQPIRVEGACMEPMFHDRDVVMVRVSEQAENGQVVIALLDDDTITSKRLRREGGRVFLEAHDAAWPEIPAERFKIIGIVEGYSRSL